MVEPEYGACSRAKRQYEAGNVKGAVDTLEEYLATDPHNLKARLHLAQYSVYGQKNVEYGMMQLDIILDIDPDYTDALLAKVTVMSKFKKYNDETDALFQRLISLKQSSEIYHTYARFLRNQMVDFEKSAEYYEKALALAPRNPDIRQNYTILLLNDLKDYEKAKKNLEILLDQKPNDPQVKKAYDRLMKEKFDKDGNLKQKRFGFLKR